MSGSSSYEDRDRQATAGLLVAPESRQARRRLGTTAWAVLEDVTLDARLGDQGRLEAVTNVRRIALRLGISKDTAAWALRRLADAGLVERQSRRGETGTFTASVYLLRLDHGSGLVHRQSAPRPTTPCPDAPDTADLNQPADQSSADSPARPRRSPSRGSSRRRPQQGGLFAIDLLEDHRR